MKLCCTSNLYMLHVCSYHIQGKIQICKINSLHLCLDEHITAEARTMIVGMAALKFRVASLHPWQTNIISATLEGKDSLVVQPTGSGKSICFIIQPLIHNKTAIVITPTISLMTDQVNKLINQDISATLLGTAQKKDVMKMVEEGQYQVVYTTPESFYDKTNRKPRSLFLKMARADKLSLIAIDEANLISSWKCFR